MADATALTATEARVLGALIEKQLTTPDAYPLTLNALTTACNQTSNRDPIVRYEPYQVETTVLVLKTRGLARVVHPGSGERATKYRHVADETLGLDGAERAVICVLLLRGAQTAPELRTRTERLHPFATPADVEQVLEGLARRDPPLVSRIDRQPGQKEPRWLQLLEEGAEARAAAMPAATTVTPSARAANGRVDELEARVTALEARLAQLTDALGDLIELPPG
jgi:uncharacterized protein YceH (UPF0502 family)